MAHVDPLELFRSDTDLSETALTKPFMYAAPSALGFGTFVFHNYMTKRPALSGIQRHIFGFTVGLLVGHFAYKFRREKHARRDAIYMHYIELHPEDFPPRVRHKYKDVMQPWCPIR